MHSYIALSFCTTRMHNLMFMFMWKIFRYSDICTFSIYTDFLWFV